MTFMDPAEEQLLRGKLSNDLSHLGRIYKAKNSKYQERSVDHALVETALLEGWEEFGPPLKTKTKLRKRKIQNSNFSVFIIFIILQFPTFPFGESQRWKKSTLGNAQGLGLHR